MVAPSPAPKVSNGRDEKHQPKSQHQSAAQSGGNYHRKRWANRSVAWIRLIQTSDYAGRQGRGLACSHVGQVLLRFVQRLGLLTDVGKLIGVFRSQYCDILDAFVDARQFHSQRLNLCRAHLEIGVEVADHAVDFGVQLIANFLLGELRSAKLWMVRAQAARELCCSKLRIDQPILQPPQRRMLIEQPVRRLQQAIVILLRLGQQFERFGIRLLRSAWSRILSFRLLLAARRLLVPAVVSTSARSSSISPPTLLSVAFNFSVAASKSDVGQRNASLELRDQALRFRLSKRLHLSLELITNRRCQGDCSLLRRRRHCKKEHFIPAKLASFGRAHCDGAL